MSIIYKWKYLIVQNTNNWEGRMELAHNFSLTRGKLGKPLIARLRTIYLLLLELLLVTQSQTQCFEKITFDLGERESFCTNARLSLKIGNHLVLLN